MKGATCIQYELGNEGNVERKRRAEMGIEAIDAHVIFNTDGVSLRRTHFESRRKLHLELL